jgi:hypothetical protein
MKLFAEMRDKHREWTRTIEQIKALPWREFLDKANSRNLWKAARYMQSRVNYANIPLLIFRQSKFTENKEKASVLMESFPNLAEPNLGNYDSAERRDPLETNH